MTIKCLKNTFRICFLTGGLALGLWGCFGSDSDSKSSKETTPPPAEDPVEDPIAAEPQIPDPSCFDLDSSDDTIIIGYYTHEGDNSSNPACPLAIIIPDGITRVRVFAFYSKGLTHVTFPDSLTSIYEGGFGGNKLTSVNLEHVTYMEDDAFSNNSLTSITLSQSLTFMQGYTFEENALTTLTIPDSVTEIGLYAFRNNNLTSVSIGSGVTNIGNGIFDGNEDLSEVCIEAAEANITIAEGAFPTGVSVIYDADGDCTNN